MYVQMQAHGHTHIYVKNAVRDVVTVLSQGGGNSGKYIVILILTVFPKCSKDTYFQIKSAKYVQAQD